MMSVILMIVGLVAGLLSGSVGFGGGMILLPVITYFYGVEVAVPVSAVAQLLSNLSRLERNQLEGSGMVSASCVAIHGVGRLRFRQGS